MINLSEIYKIVHEIFGSRLSQIEMIMKSSLDLNSP